MKYTLLASSLLLGLATAASGALTFSGSYSEDFNSLPNASNVTSQSSSYSWVDNTTIPGWYADGVEWISGLGISDGTSTILSTNSSSVANYGDDADRTLGVARRNRNSYVALALTNDTGVALTDLTISYIGEQWRRNQSGPDGAMNFAYSTDATSVLGTGTWTEFNALDFQIPQTANGTATALDGNLAANRVSLSSTITGLNVAQGETIWLRWANDGAVNNGHYIGIDDLSITAVPEPSTFALGLGVLAFGCVLFRRRLKA